jgi:hypothetical protein
MFTIEAIRRFRAEAIDHDTMEKYMYSDNNTPCVIRGHAEDPKTFTYQAWTHPETKRRINEFAGLELQHVFDYEIGHTVSSLTLLDSLNVADIIASRAIEHSTWSSWLGGLEGGP